MNQPRKDDGPLLIYTFGMQCQSQLCVYCNLAVADTVDHIPPKLLLSKPYPDNLLTVPACLACNQSFQKDDEYTRFMTSVDIRSASQSTVQTNLPSILRSIQRPESAKFTSYLLRQSQPSTILGADGQPLGQYFEPDSDRMIATGKRMVRGLYFFETGQPLPTSLEVRVACKPGITSDHPDILQFARIFNSLPVQRQKSIGGAFEYAAGFHADWSTWLLVLYNQFTWLAIVQKPR